MKTMDQKTMGVCNQFHEIKSMVLRERYSLDPDGIRMIIREMDDLEDALMGVLYEKTIQKAILDGLRDRNGWKI